MVLEITYKKVMLPDLGIKTKRVTPPEEKKEVA